MKKKLNYILIIIFVLTLLMRLFFALSHPEFSGDESYLHLRIISHIKQSGFPMTYDPLSYGGRTFLYPQLFHYLMLPFSLIPILLKLILAISASTIVLITYVISKEITGKKGVSLITALLSAFIPIEIQTNVNKLSVYSIILPLILLMFYFLMKIEKKRYLLYFMIISFILPLLHPISFLIVFSFLFYMIISATESIELTKLKKEAMIFSALLITLLNFLMFKKGLIRDGFSIVKSNISSTLIEASQIEFNIIQYLYLLGIIPLILGIIGIYIGIFKKKNENIILLSSSLLSIITLMILNVLEIGAGALLLSPFLIIISSLTLDRLSEYIKITKFHKLRKYFITILVLMVLLFSVIPSVITAVTSSRQSQEIEDLEWLSQNVNENTTIVSIPEQGNLITGITNCKNVVDSNYILAPDLEERLNDVFYIYNTWSESKALQLLEKYDVDYILFTKKAKQKYGINKLTYTENEKCFKQERETLYKVKC